VPIRYTLKYATTSCTCAENIHGDSTEYDILRVCPHKNMDQRNEVWDNGTARLSVRNGTILTDRPPLVGEFYCQLLRIERCHAVSAVFPYGR
jgi:hypothetical protein